MLVKGNPRLNRPNSLESDNLTYFPLSALINGTSELIQGPIQAKLSYVGISNVTLHMVNATSGDVYANRTCPVILGQNFGAGTEDGRGVANVTEGDLKPNEQYVSMGAMLKETPQGVKDCQHVKVPLLTIGQFGIAVTNFETTTIAGRRIRKSIKMVLQDAGVMEVELATISNGYAGYMATREEYLTQNYEGASKLFGPNQLAAVQQELKRVARSVVDPSVPLDVGPTSLQFNRSAFAAVELNTTESAPFQDGFSHARTQPAPIYNIGSVESAEFAGAHPMNALTRVTSFCDVQKLDSAGVYATVLTDAHWDLRFYWERFNESESKNKCEWNFRTHKRGWNVPLYSSRILERLVGQVG